MTKVAAPAEIRDAELHKANGGLFTLDIGTTENLWNDARGTMTIKSKEPKGVLLGEEGRD